MRASVTGIYGAYFLVRLEEGPREPILAKPRGKLRIRGNQVRGEHMLAIGDRIEVQLLDEEKESGKDEEFGAYILEALPRENSFRRASPVRTQILGANLDCIVFVTSIDDPPFNEGLLGRIQVEATLSHIPLAVVLNKTDLKEKNPEKKEEYAIIEQKLEYFKQFGVVIFYESLHHGLSASLQSFFTQGRYLTCGESGVGKSTLLNSFAGNALQVVGETGQTGMGRHTTTNPVLYEFPGGVEIIDIPGIREFGMVHREPASLSGGFADFAPYSCRFDNCLHINEPDCGVKDAVTQGIIPEARYRFYEQLVTSCSERYKPRRGDYRREPSSGSG